MKNNALLLGSFGQTNIGDDILLYNCLLYLERFGFEKIYINANVADNIPDMVEKRFLNILIFETYTTTLLAWLSIIRDCDIVFYGGGTIYKELYQSTGRSRYAVITRIFCFNLACVMAGKKIINLYIGIGSIKTWLGRMITKFSLKLSTFTIFRDTNSYAFAINNLRLPEKKFISNVDGIFLSHIWQEEAGSSLQLVPALNKKIVGVNLLSDINDDADRKRYIISVCAFLNDLLKDDYYLVFIPFQHDFNRNNDYEFMAKNIIPYLEIKNFTILPKINLEDISAIFKKLDAFVGMRFHSLLLAGINQVPFLALEYDTKCTRLITELDYPYSLKVEDMTRNEMSGKFACLMGNAEGTKIKLKAYMDKNFQKIYTHDLW